MRRRSPRRPQPSTRSRTASLFRSSAGSCTCRSCMLNRLPHKHARSRCSRGLPTRAVSPIRWYGRRSTPLSSVASADTRIATHRSAAYRQRRKSPFSARRAAISEYFAYHRLMGLIEITLGLLLAVAAVAALGKWIGAPLPLLLVAGGVCLSFLPGFRSLSIAPDIFFLLFIPPLLFADAWLIPKRDLLKVMRPVLLLAFGLVFLTVLVVGYLMHWLVPDLPLAAAFALGAVISPTDAVAVRAVTSKLAIPSRVSTIVDGESLINDASGLIAFKFAIAAAMSGAFSWESATLQFFVSSGGGFLLGLAIAWTIGQARVGLRRFCADDPTIQTVISLLTPYAAYLAAEALDVGTILAIVGAGLYAGAHDLRHLDAATRAHSWEVWRMVLFAFNGLVFVLLGVELHSIIGALSRSSALELAGYALALSAIVISLRVLWVFPAAYLPLLLSRRIREREGVHSPRAVFLTGWAGIRGSITLAAALSILFVTSSGAPFPGR